LKAKTACAALRTGWSIATGTTGTAAAAAWVSPAVEPFATGIALARGASASDERSI
jgi:hypothetical protein